MSDGSNTPSQNTTITDNRLKSEVKKALEELERDG